MSLSQNINSQALSKTLKDSNTLNLDNMMESSLEQLKFLLSSNNNGNMFNSQSIISINNFQNSNNNFNSSFKNIFNNFELFFWEIKNILFPNFNLDIFGNNENFKEFTIKMIEEIKKLKMNFSQNNNINNQDKINNDESNKNKNKKDFIISKGNEITLICSNSVEKENKFVIKVNRIKNKNIKKKDILQIEQNIKIDIIDKKDNIKNKIFEKPKNYNFIICKENEFFFIKENQFLIKNEKYEFERKLKRPYRKYKEGKENKNKFNIPDTNNFSSERPKYSKSLDKKIIQIKNRIDYLKILLK